MERWSNCKMNPHEEDEAVGRLHDRSRDDNLGTSTLYPSVIQPDGYMYENDFLPTR
jgi:hypothetical protein